MSRWWRWLVTVGVLLAVTGGGALGISRLHVDSDLDSLLPADDATVTAMHAMARGFGQDPIVVLIEGGGDPLGQKRLPQLFRLEGQLSQISGVVATYGPATTLNQTVVRVKQMLADLSGQRDALQQAHLTRQLATFDRRYGSLIVRAMPAGLPTLSNEGFVRTVVIDPRTGRPRSNWRQYLPADDTVAIYLRPRAGLSQHAATAVVDAVRKVVADSGAVPRGATVTVAGAPVVSTDLASRVRSEVPRLALSAFLLAAVVLFLIPWTPRRRDRLVPLGIMAVAVVGTLGGFGWLDQPLSIGAATFLPIILGIGSYYPVYLSRARHRRVVLAVATSSALAFLGLVLSPLPFVAELGIAVPAGLALVVALSLLVTWARWAAGHDPAAAADLKQLGRGSWSPILRMPRPVSITLTCLIVAASILGWAQLASAQLKTDPQQLLAGLPSLEDATHVEDVLGYSGEIDVRLTGGSALAPAALRWSRLAEQRVVTAMGDRVHPVVTYADLLSFLGDKPTAEQVKAGVAALPPYIAGAVLAADGDQALTSYGVSWSDIASDHHLVGDLEKALPAPPAGYHVTTSGMPVAAQRGYELVSSERYEPSLVALAAAGIALLLLLGRGSSSAAYCADFRPRSGRVGPARRATRPAVASPPCQIGPKARSLRRRMRSHALGCRDALLAVLAAALAAGMNIALLEAVVGSLNPLTVPLGALTAAVGAEFTVLLAAARRDRDTGTRTAVLLAVLLSLGGYGVLLTSSLPVLRELGLALTASVALSALVAVTLTSLIGLGTVTDRDVRRSGDHEGQLAAAPATPAAPELDHSPAMEPVGGA